MSSRSAHSSGNLPVEPIETIVESQKSEGQWGQLIEYSDRSDTTLRPTWPIGRVFINDEHSNVFDRTSNIPGWQAKGDTYKLFEMAYFAGDVILEIGVYSGRSAAVQLKGALSNPQRTTPQFFGVDIDPVAIPRTQKVLQDLQLDHHALLFCGDLVNFARGVNVTPTMVFLDGHHSYEAVNSDLEVLSWYLAKDTPLLCHDFTNAANDTGEYGVRQACKEWEERGYLRFMGVFGCSALFLTTAHCQRPRGGLPTSTFEQAREDFARPKPAPSLSRWEEFKRRVGTFLR